MHEHRVLTRRICRVDRSQEELDYLVIDTAPGEGGPSVALLVAAWQTPGEKVREH
jgi:hypothetical protein